MKNFKIPPTLSKFLILLLCFFTVHTADAQIWRNTGKKIQKKLENQADKRLERKLDQSIDKGFDKVESSTEDAVKSKGDKSKDNSNNNSNEGYNGNSMERMLSSLQSDIKLPNSYQFHLGIKYNISTTKGGKKKENDVQTSIWFSNDEYVGMSTDQQSGMFMVLDKNAMVTFMEKEKSYMAISTDFINSFAQSAIDNEDDEDDNISFKKIGTERILGYLCDIYLAETNDSKSKVWISKEFDSEGGSLIKAFSMLNKDKGNNPLSPDLGAFGGLVLKIESDDGKESMTMIATEIDKKGKKINTGEYKKTGF